MSSATIDVRVLSGGHVSDRDKSQARDAVLRVTHRTGVPLTAAQVKLSLSEDPANEMPAVVQAAVALRGEPIRAVAAAPTMSEATRIVCERLRRQIEHHSDRRLARRQRGLRLEPSEWRHGDLPTDRPERYPRPAEERRIKRHKTYALDPLSVEGAAQEMAALDYDFHLYTHLDTGRDAIVQRDSEGSILERTVVDADVPLLDVPAATSWLDLSGEPWLFFREAASDRGAVAYHRYDGHYGLITPRSGTPPVREDRPQG